MGIDIGGTYTKAVVVDNATYEIIGKPSVRTTHDDPREVVTGMAKSLGNCLNESGISPDDVVLTAHSTIQATNALTKDDVAVVGAIGMTKGGLEGLLTKRQTKLDDIDLGDQKKIKIVNDLISVRKMNMTVVEDIVNSMQKPGVQVLVPSVTLGMGDGGPEAEVYGAVSAKGIPTTMASDTAKFYGLIRKTRTAAISASIFPEMLDIANSTEGPVREAGVHVPLMTMKGDGGVTEVTEMGKHSVLTMLSGPAASVMGSLMYLGVFNGAYFEVDGTTTNTGTIRDRRPAIDYSIVGSHATYISPLDVWVLGTAGSSMAWVNKQGVVDVGPRSAHIAGPDYAVSMGVDKIRGPKVEFFSPKQEDPDDHVRIRMEDGSAVTPTNSRVVSVLGLAKPGHFSYGDVGSARKAVKAPADYCGTTVEDIAK